MKLSGWKQIAGLLAMLVTAVCLLTVVFLAKPLPPPKVSLLFRGFSGFVTNPAALICFTNEGKQSVWWSGSWEVVSETASGRPQQSRISFSGWPSRTPPAGSFVLSVSLPADAVQWRVKTQYEHYLQRPLRLELQERLLKFGITRRMPQLFWKAASWCLKSLPDPKPETGEASTFVLTNRHPDVSPPADTPVPAFFQIAR